MVRDMLIAPHIPSSLVPLLVSHFTKLHPGEEDQVTLTAEIIADVREPISILETSITTEEKRKRELKVHSKGDALLFSVQLSRCLVSL